MKYLYCVCLLIVLCQGQKQKKLKDPGKLKVTTHDEPLSFDVAWSKVDKVEDDDPILGYKVKVVTLRRITTWTFTPIGNTSAVRLTQTDIYPPISPLGQPEGDEDILTVEGESTLQTTITDLAPEQSYETVVAAYTSKQTGRWSEPVRVLVNPPNWQIIDLDTPPDPPAIKPDKITAILPPIKK